MAVTSGGLGGLGGYSPTDTATQLYQDFLGRTPDQAALQNIAATSPTYSDLFNSITSSPEYRSHTISNYYNDLFGRPADQAGLDYYNNSGLPLGDIFNTMENSPEAQTYLAQYQPPSNVNPVPDASGIPPVNIQQRTPFMQLPDLSAPDLDRMIRTLYGEARGQGIDGMQAVANVIRNRLAMQTQPGAQSFGHDVTTVTSPNQFSAWRPNDPNYAKMMALNPNSDTYKQIADLVRGVWTGSLPDNTHGATFYYGPGGASNPQMQAIIHQFGPQNTTKVGSQTFMGLVDPSLYGNNLPAWWPGGTNVTPPPRPADLTAGFPDIPSMPTVTGDPRTDMISGMLNNTQTDLNNSLNSWTTTQNAFLQNPTYFGSPGALGFNTSPMFSSSGSLGQPNNLSGGDTSGMDVLTVPNPNAY